MYFIIYFRRLNVVEEGVKKGAGIISCYTNKMSVEKTERRLQAAKTRDDKLSSTLVQIYVNQDARRRTHLSANNQFHQHELSSCCTAL